MRLQCGFKANALEQARRIKSLQNITAEGDATRLTNE